MNLGFEVSFLVNDTLLFLEWDTSRGFKMLDRLVFEGRIELGCEVIAPVCQLVIYTFSRLKMALRAFLSFIIISIASSRYISTTSSSFKASCCFFEFSKL